jgi:hypothetical protein
MGNGQSSPEDDAMWARLAEKVEADKAAAKAKEEADLVAYQKAFGGEQEANRLAAERKAAADKLAADNIRCPLGTRPDGSCKIKITNGCREGGSRGPGTDKCCYGGIIASGPSRYKCRDDEEWYGATRALCYPKCKPGYIGDTASICMNANRTIETKLWLAQRQRCNGTDQLHDGMCYKDPGGGFVYSSPGFYKKVGCDPRWDARDSNITCQFCGEGYVQGAIVGTCIANCAKGYHPSSGGDVIGCYSDYSKYPDGTVANVITHSNFVEDAKCKDPKQELGSVVNAISINPKRCYSRCPNPQYIQNDENCTPIPPNRNIPNPKPKPIPVWWSSSSTKLTSTPTSTPTSAPTSTPTSTPTPTSAPTSGPAISTEKFSNLSRPSFLETQKSTVSSLQYGSLI